MFTFTRSQMKGAAFSGFILGIAFMLLAGCALNPEPLPTQEPYPTSTSYPTQTPYPTFTPPPTSVPPTLTPLPTETAILLTPTEEIAYLLVRVTEDAPLHEVCKNKKGEFIFNKAGFPLIEECFFSTDGLPNGRIKYLAGEQLLVYAHGDAVFFEIYGSYTLFGNAEIKADGGNRYLMVAGPRGNGFFIDRADVEILGPGS